MNKIGSVILIVVVVVLVYLGMIVFMPVVSDLAATANATAAASTNMTNYPGANEFVMSTPWILWFVPATFGAGAIITVLKW